MLKMQSLQIVPIESVYCTIEIKSTLTKNELQKCVNNIKSVRSLEKSTITTRVLRLGIDITIGCVFTYTSDISLERLLEHLKEMNKTIPKEQQISFICVLDKGLIYNVDNDGMTSISLYPNENTELVMSVKDLEDSLSLFYLLVLEHLNRCELLPPNLIEYARKQNAFNLKPNLNVNDLSDIGSVDTIMGKIAKKDIKTLYKDLQNITPYLKKKVKTKEDFINMLISSYDFKRFSEDNQLRFGNNLAIDFDVIKIIMELKMKITDKTIIPEELDKYEILSDNLFKEYQNVEKKLSESSQQKD